MARSIWKGSIAFGVSYEQLVEHLAAEWGTGKTVKASKAAKPRKRAKVA